MKEREREERVPTRSLLFFTFALASAPPPFVCVLPKQTHPFPLLWPTHTTTRVSAGAPALCASVCAKKKLQNRRVPKISAPSLSPWPPSLPLWTPSWRRVKRTPPWTPPWRQSRRTTGSECAGGWGGGGEKRETDSHTTQHNHFLSSASPPGNFWGAPSLLLGGTGPPPLRTGWRHVGTPATRRRRPQRPRRTGRPRRREGELGSKIKMWLRQAFSVDSLLFLAPD